MDEWLRERLRTHARGRPVDNAWCLTVRDAKAAGLPLPSEEEFVAEWRAASGFTAEDRAFLAKAGILAE
jgi:hypothetical protein